MIYFGGDSFEEFRDVMISILNERITFTEEDSFIIQDLSQ
jgi:hypothetical protein